MTQEEALKLALEALGEIEWSNNSQWQSDRAKVAITAIKEALAQPEERNFCPRCGKRTQDIHMHTTSCSWFTGFLRISYRAGKYAKRRRQMRDCWRDSSS